MADEQPPTLPGAYVNIFNESEWIASPFWGYAYLSASNVWTGLLNTFTNVVAAAVTITYTLLVPVIGATSIACQSLQVITIQAATVLASGAVTVGDSLTVSNSGRFGGTLRYANEIGALLNVPAQGSFPLMHSVANTSAMLGGDLNLSLSFTGSITVYPSFAVRFLGAGGSVLLFVNNTGGSDCLYKSLALSGVQSVVLYRENAQI